MGKFDGILICTDLDGTLLKNDKSVSERNLEAIEYFKQNGGYFTIMTGRAPGAIFDYCETVKPNLPFGCNGGGGIYNYDAKKYEWIEALPREVNELIRCIDEELPDVAMEINTDTEIMFYKDNSAMARLRYEEKLPCVTCDYNKIGKPLTKIVFAHEKEETILKIAELLHNHPLSDKFSFMRTQYTLYEILPKNANKEFALGKLCELYNIKRKNTIGVGDYDNDVKMLEAAGVGIAVANACENAKNAADYITVSNEEDAIAQIVSDIEKGKYL